VTTTQLVVLLVLSVGWGILGYFLSEQARRNRGATPWGLPSLVWAFFWFLSLALGLILFLVYMVTRDRGARRVWSQPPPTGAFPGAGVDPASARGQANPGSNFPAYPRPAGARPITGRSNDHDHLPSPPASSAPDVSASRAAVHQVPLSPPAWHPDPSGRFHYRWWDGSEWTSQVSVDGAHMVDTSPDQRIGPY
jgi:hypothetical protein